jgi:ABC-type sugar transport system ATPase subunit
MSGAPVETVLSASGVNKRFGSTTALADSHLDVLTGGVHGLVGANGAGKSTLVKILSGALTPDSGAVRIGSWEGHALNPRLAQELGIATIYQDPDLVPTLGAAENIALGREQRRGGIFVNRRTELEDARSVGGRVGMHSQLFSRPVEQLSRADQQLVEIAKALHRRARVILMDEPTAPLGPAEVERLRKVIADLSSQGVAILYISHRLREVLDVCDSVTVMRDGRTVWTRAADTLTEPDIVQAMIGQGVASLKPEAPSEQEAGEVVLSASNIRQGSLLSDVSLELRRGEIVGLAGLVGAGRSRLLKALAGQGRIDEGRMTFRGSSYRPRTPAAAIRQGVGLLPEDRKSEGLFLEMSVAKNITFIRSPTRLPGVVFRRAELSQARRWMERLRIVASRPSAPVGTLSGGNQQKVLLARLLNADADVLLIDEPGQGVDIAGKQDIVEIVREAAKGGKAVLISSSEFEELFALADRILVMQQGKIVGELPAAQASEEQIVALASGATDPESHGRA